MLQGGVYAQKIGLSASCLLPAIWQTTLRKLRSTWAPFLDKHMPRTCRVILAGNKADCRGDSHVGDAEVFEEEAKVAKDIINHKP